MAGPALDALMVALNGLVVAAWSALVKIRPTQVDGFESEDFATVGSLVLVRLGRLSRSGDDVRLSGYLLRVQAAGGPRIARGIARKEYRGGPT